MENNERIGLVYTAIATFAYSFVPVLSRAILTTDFPAFDLAIWRFGLATPTIWLMIYWRQRTNPVITDQRLPRLKLMGVGSIMAGVVVTTFVGLERIPASTFIVVFYSYPAMVAVLSTFIGIHLTARSWIALVLTLIGILITSPDFFEKLGNGEITGYLAILVSAFLLAIYFILNSKVTRGYVDLPRASAWTITGAFVPLAFLALFVDVQIPVEAHVWGNLVGLAVLGTAISIFTLLIGINKLGAARAAILTTAQIPLSILLAVLLIGEQLTVNHIAGSILIMMSVVLLNTRVNVPRLLRFTPRAH